MLNLLREGGWVMYPLLALSIIALTVILERGVYYFLTRQRFEAFLETLAGGRELQTKLLVDTSRGPFTRMACAYFAAMDNDNDAFEEKLFAEGSRIIRVNEKRLSVLALIAGVAPLMGLFGTVLGMIEVFRKLQSMGGRADVELLSGGIWVALLTTAFGLLVAIPATIAHHYFSGIVTERSDNLQLLISHLNVLTGRKKEQHESISAV
jgi:biopolymer transport protein ExbB